MDKGMVALITIVLLLLYSVVYDGFSSADEAHCNKWGMAYGGTSPSLVAHCVTPQGKRIKASLVGTVSWEGEQNAY